MIVFYYGGPSHLDTYDLKPDAPAEVRGEFQPIATSVPGLFVCEHLPNMARSMHKVALVRGMHHQNRLHDSASTEALTGRQSPTGDREEFGPIKQFFPCYGASLNYLRHELQLDVPHAALPFVFHNVVDVPCQGGGFLGSTYDPLQISVDPKTRLYSAGALALPAGQSAESLEERRRLLFSLQQGSIATAQPSPQRLWQLSSQKAFELLASESLREALDLAASRRIRAIGTDTINPLSLSAPAAAGAMGRRWDSRVTCAGKTCSLPGGWSKPAYRWSTCSISGSKGRTGTRTHQNFDQHKSHLLPVADQSLAALIEDLDERGLLDTTLVVAMGEFGRTPTINKNGGRDHWPDCYTVLLAGGGVKGGACLEQATEQGRFPRKTR